MDEIAIFMMEQFISSVVPTDPKALELYQWLKKFKWIDNDFGQLEFYELKPAVAFPCALISVEIEKTVDQGEDIQLCYARAGIRMAWDYTGRTSANTPAVIRQQSNEHYKLINAVYRTFQGKIGIGETIKNFKFSRRSTIREKRPDGLTVIDLAFNTTFLDRTAQK